jgi:hypothetical protein
VPSYLVELYSPASRAAEVRAGVDRLTSGGGPVRHLRATFIPTDETCFHVLEAPSLDAARQALEQAAIDYERIVEATE